MDSTTRVIAVLILLTALVVVVIVTQFARRRRDLFPLRVIPAYEAVPLLVGQAIEADQPLHLSFGSTPIGGTSTPLALANAEFFYHVANRTATGDVMPIFTMSETSVIPLAYDTLRRAYRDRNRLDRFSAGAIRWYPSGSQTLAFAAALTATLGDDRVSGNILGGTYGPELALILDAAARRRQAIIATSDRLDGQAVAYALSDQPLIGEEVFAAGAYLGDSRTQVGAIAAQDILRLLLVLLILVPAAVAVGDYLTGNAVTEALIRLLGSR